MRQIAARLWRAWTARIDPSLSLAGYISALAGTSAGAAMIAWAISTWAWYWDTFKWAGIALAFLGAFFIFSLSFYLIALAAKHWRRRTEAEIGWLQIGGLGSSSPVYWNARDGRSTLYSGQSVRYAHDRQLDPSFRTHRSGSRHGRFVP